MENPAPKKGIVAVVALGIFALLAVFGIIIANIVNNSYTNVKNTDDYLQAKALGDSALEFLEQQLQNLGPGYNSGEIVCNYNGADDEGPNGGAPHDYCDNFREMVGNEPVTITMEIKGRANPEEKLNSRNCGDGRNNFADCYTVPLPGTGNAGKDCELYKPAYGNEGSPVVPAQIAGRENVDQVDYACNWNKLSLGSSQTQGVSIPLYFTESENIDYHPFIEEENTTFFLRLRTPCNCPPEARDCSYNACGSRQRYQLEDSNSTLVDWQISGLCGEEGNYSECGLISASDPEVEGSRLTPSLINDKMLNRRGTVIRSNEENGLNNTLHPAIAELISDRLSLMSSPLFKLALINSLRSRNEENIPYLEYQIISNQPTSSSNLKLEVNIQVGSTQFKSSKGINNQSAIIDFAIQN